MARCPFAIWKPLYPENTTEPRITPTQHIRHTAITTATSLFGYFNRLDVNTESTFYIAQDGTLEQYMDTERQADAQFEGNLHGVSTETWDNGAPKTTPWTPAQLATDKRLSLWLRDTHGIPLTACTWSQGAGQGYHSMFVQWAKDGHTCPDALRIGQFWNVILPGLQERPVTQPKLEFDMVPAQVRDKNGSKWFFVVGDDLDLWASVDNSGFFPVIQRGADGKPRTAWSSGFSAVLEASGEIVVAGRGADGRAWQVVFTPGSGAAPYIGVVDSHPHHIFPPA